VNSYTDAPVLIKSPLAVAALQYDSEKVANGEDKAKTPEADPEKTETSEGASSDNKQDDTADESAQAETDTQGEDQTQEATGDE